MRQQLVTITAALSINNTVVVSLIYLFFILFYILFFVLAFQFPFERGETQEILEGEGESVRERASGDNRRMIIRPIAITTTKSEMSP